MPISAPPPSWASIKNKPNTISGFGITDTVVNSLDGQAGAITLSSISAFAKSLSGTGYQRLPGGLIIQWGFSIDAQTVTFPIAFPSAVLSAQATRSYNDDVARVTAFDRITLSGGKTLFGLGGDTGYWLAIGF